MDLEQKAIERIRYASEMSLHHYGQPLVCAYSGGKDSDVILELFRRSDIPFEVNNSHTSDKNYINDKSLEGEFLVDKNTICQYTGLIDKNGKKIWEGDIIKYHFGEVYAPVKFGEYQSCFDSTSTRHVGFYVDWNENHDFRKDLGYWIKLADAEVVGNLFDNPELLEEEGN